jgi:hypothetical protein
MNLQNIEIDFDIHKMIEAERLSFEEQPYIALRRLLKLPVLEANTEGVGATIGEGVPFMEDGVIIPHGSLARMEYQRGKQVYEGQFMNGNLVVNGQSFSALSAAASVLAVTKKGGKTSLNGWLYWQVKFPAETKWRSLGKMRSEVTQ